MDFHGSNQVIYDFLPGAFSPFSHELQTLTLNPSPKPGEGLLASLLPAWEKGLGDEGSFVDGQCQLRVYRYGFKPYILP